MPSRPLFRSSALIAFALVSITASAQLPNPYGMAVGIDDAKKVAAPALAEAKKNNWLIAVAIVDPAGDLVYFEKADSAMNGAAHMAIEKARSLPPLSVGGPKRVSPSPSAPRHPSWPLRPGGATLTCRRPARQGHGEHGEVGAIGPGTRPCRSPGRRDRRHRVEGRGARGSGSGRGAGASRRRLAASQRRRAPAYAWG